MNTLLQADIFFFITSIAVVVVAIALCIGLWHCIHILRDARHITGKMRQAADALYGDFEHLRSEVKDEGRRAKFLVDFFLNAFFGKIIGKQKGSSRKKPNAEDTV